MESSPLRALTYLAAFSSTRGVGTKPPGFSEFSRALSLVGNSSQAALPLGKVKVLVTQSSLTLCHPVDCSPPGSSVHGVLQMGLLE